ncbi:carbonic anhydrase [bacterium]|nr:carbonic anhydrase [bacterium]|tara:strand:- start:4351 stop:4767 length:417 start_codon:yes stop_codon:yes gene_type:complete
MNNKYKAMVLSCIDPRFQPLVFNYLKKRKLSGKYSSFTIAGAAIGVTSPKFKQWHKTFWENLSTSIELHKIDKLIVFNHTDCGAAKIINPSKEFNQENEEKIHISSFEKIKKALKRKHPNLKIELNLISLDKTVKKFK